VGSLVNKKGRGYEFKLGGKINLKNLKSNAKIRLQSYLQIKKIVPGTNTLAYLSAASVTNKRGLYHYTIVIKPLFSMSLLLLENKLERSISQAFSAYPNTSV